MQDSPLGEPEQFLASWKERLAILFGRAAAGFDERLEQGRKDLALLSGRLDALSPLKVLSRGYSVVTDQTGTIVRDADTLAPGDVVSIRMAAGEAPAQIIERRKK